MVAITAILRSLQKMIDPYGTKTENWKPHETFPKGKEKLFPLKIFKILMP